MIELPSGAVLLDGSASNAVAVVNSSDVPTADVMAALERQDRGLFAALEGWVSDTRGPLRAWAETTSTGPASRHSGGLFERDRYVTPENPYEQMRLAGHALSNDDVVAGVAESTESLAFSRVDFFAEDPDEQDVYNQIAARIDLDGVLRQMWRELFTVSQVYVAVSWQTQTFRVRGKTADGNPRRKQFSIRAPKTLTLLNPLKIVPVGNPYAQSYLGQDSLAYIADRGEDEAFDKADRTTDPVLANLITSRYEPQTRQEASELQDLGVNTRHLWLLNPNNVFRHTATRPGYYRLADVRMRSVFELLDMKHQLRQMERAHLIGGPLRVDQRIATPEGWKPIGAAKVGDKVLSVDGRETEIIGVYPQGVLPMYRVTFTDGAEIYCDGSHPWTVRAPKGTWRTITLDQILAEGLVQPNGNGASGHPQKRWLHEIPMAAPLQLPERDLPVDPYLLGYLLGDGCLVGGSPKMACGEPIDSQTWREGLPSGCRVVPNPANPHEWTISRVPRGRQPAGEGDRANPLTALLRRLGLWGHGTRDKFIPDDYLWASVDQRWALLQGLLDSDGSARPSCGASFGNTSPKLIAGVKQLVQSLGGIAKETRSASHPEFSHLNILLPQAEPPFRLERKRAVYRAATRGVRRCIAKVERSLDAEAVCIKVDREDGLFLSEDLLVAHNTNFIVLITKGTDQHPALPAEIANLQMQVKTVARVPILVGDHRLSVEIVTPKLDNTLRAERWNAIDSRITARLYQMFMLGNYAAGASGDDSVKLVKVIARGMESRRHMMLRSLEKHLFKPLYDGNEELTSRPKLQFHPRSIALDFDAAYASFLFDLRQAKELSRETILNQFDLNQGLEAALREREEELYDDIFQTQVPFTAPPPPPNNQPPDGNQPGGKPPPGNQPPAQNLPRDNGGGRRNGGGAAPGTGQGEPPRRVGRQQRKPSK